jgi:ribosomal protein S18 acetylase RimI-like enzyme
MPCESQPPMRLRPYRSQDLTTLHEIDRACFAPGIAYTRGELAGFIGHRSSQTWIAEDEESETITGFLIATREPRKILHIVTIDVVEAWRRKRVGALLMDAAENWAWDNKLRLVGLETAENNLGAQRFYEARGYAKVDRLEGYYPGGLAAWVMVKDLS